MKTRLALAAVIGLAIGTATSFGQEDLGSYWQSLANAASPWLLGAFAAGALHHRRNWAITAGGLACLLEVVGYYVVTPLRGFAVAQTEIMFWSGCAVLGGPLFGWAGWAWRRGPERLRPIGAAALPATFLAEAIGTYVLRLHHRGDAVLFACLAAVFVVVVASCLLRWWQVLLPVAVVTLFGVGVYGWVVTSAMQRV